MRLYVDTSNYEDISIKISDEEYETGLASTIEEFCYQDILQASVLHAVEYGKPEPCALVFTDIHA